MRLVLSAFVGAVLVLGLSGCSGKSKKYKVSGRLTQGGNPLKMASATGGPPAAGAFASGIQLVFYALPEDGSRPADPNAAGLENVFAVVQEDGAYAVPGGLRQGKYLVTVRHSLQGPMGKDALNEQFSFKNSKILLDLEGEKSFEIELNSYK